MNPSAYFQFVAALAFVLALIAGLAWAIRRFGWFAQMVPRQSGQRRLSVVETAILDGKRRMVLVRRDDKEHLLVLGPASEIVIETGITPQGPPKAEGSKSAG